MTANTLISPQAVLSQLQAIATTNATDLLQVRQGSLQIRDTAELTAQQQAAVAAIEKTAGGIKVKFYDKLKALELLGKYLGLFEGGAPGGPEENNLLCALLAATQQEVQTHDLPEIQQAAAGGHDLVGTAQSEEV